MTLLLGLLTAVASPPGPSPSFSETYSPFLNPFRQGLSLAEDGKPPLPRQQRDYRASTPFHVANFRSCRRFWFGCGAVASHVSTFFSSTSPGTSSFLPPFSEGIPPPPPEAVSFFQPSILRELRTRSGPRMGRSNLFYDKRSPQPGFRMSPFSPDFFFGEGK